MKKLALKLDDLTVETFATAAAQPGPGTVRGRDATLHCEDETFYVSCNFTTCPLDCETTSGASNPYATNCCSYDGSCPGTCYDMGSAPQCC